MSHSNPTPSSSSHFQLIINNALDLYKKRTKNDLLSHPLAAQLQISKSPTEILAVLQEQVQGMHQSQRSDERWSRWLDPTVNVLYTFSATLGEGVSLIFSPAKVIFAGVGVLLSAAKDVRTSQDTLINIFERIEMFFRRLDIYIEVPATTEMMEIIVQIMAEVLSVLGIATKEIRQGRMKKYAKKLIGRTEMEDALKRLDNLTQEEARMAAAQNLKVTHDVNERMKGVANTVEAIDDKVVVVDERVAGVDDRVAGVDERVAGVDDRVAGVDERVAGVDDRVAGVDERVAEVDDRVAGVDVRVAGVDDRVAGVDERVAGVDDRVAGVDERVASVNERVVAVDDAVKLVDNNLMQVISDGKETRVSVQEIANDVDEVKRNQLRESTYKWLSPPDPSTNHNIACGTHHKKTATWFFEGSTYREWKSTGSLLWIHGKPGSGKSVFCSTVIQDIEAMCKAGNASMAYFYFDFRDANKRSLRDLVTSLLTQLSACSSPCCDILSDLYLDHGEGKNQPSDGLLANCLKKMVLLPDQRPIYLIIDALDESPDTSGISSPREMVLQLLKQLVDFSLPNLHICVTSRPEIDIRLPLNL
ncbi:hypothetical protein BGY98DRAFT_1101489 [Russula aff. rugulosa BPL654]|nr:hypothetical protein BGY98DRAFT_1101489 [Russula aff. rugulosa BPL654]